MTPFRNLLEKETRLVGGLMSGTSLDGIDAAVARLTGSGRGMQVELLAFVSRPYPDDLRALLLRNSVEETSSVRDLSQLNVRLVSAYVDTLAEAAALAGLDVGALDLVGSHGQTLHHVPAADDCAGEAVTSTLQLGDPSVMANRLGVAVVGDFRVADMALGGQGAPLVPYFDYVYFSDPHETRGLLNLGGIGNVTMLPAGADGPDDVLAFDTGPGNMVIDALTKRYFDRGWDERGRLAAQGHADDGVLADLLEDPYFLQPPPKSTGREYFGADFVDRLVAACRAARPDAGPHDFLATATVLTALSVYQAYARFVRDRHPLDVLIVSGGGKHNDFLMDRLAAAFSPIPVRPVDAYGLDADAKEALCFAVLAHETLNGVPTSLPSVTGATRPALLGKICLPGPWSGVR